MTKKAPGNPKNSWRPLQDTRRSYIHGQYPAWVRSNRLRASDMRRLRREAGKFENQPLISVVVPVYDPEQEWLEQALDSVLSQVYPNWELCVCDDASTKEYVRQTLSRYERLDGRIKVKYLDRNTGISGASNAALSLATGEFVALLDHDDELAPDALFEVVKLLQEHPRADLVYSDEDKIDQAGNRCGPHFKPGWSPDLLLAGNYISHLGVYRREILEEIGGFRKGFEGSQDHDLVLRFTEKTRNIHHIPKVLYHWKMVEGSAALDLKSKPYSHERSRKAISESLERRGIKGSVEDGPASNRFRVKFEIEGEPKVSIIIPTRDNLSVLKNCVESIERLTAYRNYEILIVDNDSTNPETLEYLDSTQHRVIQFREEFNHSKINNFGVSKAEGEYVLFLNDDTEVISGGWLEEILRHAQRPEVGAAGAKLLYPDGRIQHAGVVVGAGNPQNFSVATPAFRFYPGSAQGYVGAITTTKNYSAVTAACMMLRRAVFEEVGGFDEQNLPASYNDVDLCLRMRDRGYLIVYTPYAELYHHESASRGRGGGDSQETEYMRERWGEVLNHDPYYNPNFSRGDGSFNLRADMLRPHAARMGSEKDDPRSSYRGSLAAAPARGSVRNVLQDLPHGKGPMSQKNGNIRVGSESGSGDAVDMGRLIWMFGAPRTGSTWLSRMMAELRNQRVWAEPLVGMLFGSFIYGSLKNNKPAIASPNLIMGEPHREVWLESVRNFIADGAAARYPTLRGDQYLVIKEPNGSAGAPIIMEAVPESRLIFLIRDSRDAVASRLDANKKGNWGVQRGVKINWEYDTPEKLNAYTRQAAEQYQELISLVEQAYERHPGKKVLIRYEDLRQAPLDTLRYMYEVLKVEVDEAQLKDSVEKHSWERIPETDKGGGQFYRKAQPGGWEEDLSAEQVEIIEEITAPILSKYYH